MPRSSRSPFVTKRSSPTSCTRSPSRSVSAAPGLPLVLGEPVLDGDDGVVVQQLPVQVDHSRRVDDLAGAFEVIRTVLEELRRRRVERDRDPRAVADPLCRLEHDLDRLLGRAELWREAALVADAGRHALLVQDVLERMEDLGREAQRFREGVRAARHEHELLHVERVLRVRPSVHDVQHRHGQNVRAAPTEPAVERDAGVPGRRLGGGERAAENGVRAEIRFVLGAVRLDHPLVQLALVLGVHPAQRFGELVPDVSTASLTPLPSQGRRRRAARPPRSGPSRRPRAPRRGRRSRPRA